MKRIFVMALAVMAAFIFAGCGDSVSAEQERIIEENTRAFYENLMDWHGNMYVMPIDALTPFEWDELYVFGAYYTADAIREKTRVDWNGFKTSMLEETANMAFLKDGEVVCYYFEDDIDTLKFMFKDVYEKVIYASDNPEIKLDSFMPNCIFIELAKKEATVYTPATVEKKESVEEYHYSEKNITQEYPFIYTTADGNEYKAMLLCDYGGETVYQFFDFINNPQKNRLFMSTQVFLFEEKNGKLKLKYTGFTESDGTITQEREKYFEDVDEAGIWSEFSSSDYCSEAVAFLCDKDAIRKCFEEKNVRDIKDIVILDLYPGHVAVAVTENDAYYMTVPTVAKEYGDFVFKKMYTSEEFKTMFGARQAKVYINGKEADFSQRNVIIGMGCGIALGEQHSIEMDVFELLDALGVSWSFDESTRTVCFGDCKVQVGEFKWTIDPEFREFIKSAPKYGVLITTDEYEEEIGMITIRGERYLGSYALTKLICRELGYKMELDLQDYSIHIDKEQE